MICWYCYWGWPEPVAAVYAAALAALGGDDRPLEFGPSHIVWADENFDDGNIRHCLQTGVERRTTWYSDYSDEDLAVVRKSLEQLLAVPEAVRCCVPADYDGENPENYPPPPGLVMVK